MSSNKWRLLIFLWATVAHAQFTGVIGNGVLLPASSAPSTTTLGIFDAMIDMEGNSTGTTASAAVMATGTVNPLGKITSSSYTITGTAAGLTVGASQTNCGIPSGYQQYVNTTAETSSHSFQSLAIANADATTYATLFLPTATPILTVFGCYVFGQSSITGSGNTFDLIHIVDGNGHYAIFQFKNGATGSSNYCALLETDIPAGGTTSSCTPLTLNETVLYMLQFNENTGTATLELWTTAGSQIGSTLTLSNETAGYIASVEIGNSESGTDSSTSYFENTNFAWSNVASTPVPLTAWSPTVWDMQSVSNTTSSGATVTATMVAPLSGDMLWGYGGCKSSSDTLSMSDSVNGSWTAIDSKVVGASEGVQAFYKCNASTSAPTVTLTCSGSTSFNTLSVHEAHGTSCTLDQHPTANTGTSATPTSTTTGTTSHANEFAVGGCNTANDLSYPNGPWAAGMGINGSGFFGTAEQSLTATGTPQLSMTQTSSGTFVCLLDTFY